MNSQYTALYRREPEGAYTVRIKELPDCITYGDTIEEADMMIQDALQGYLLAQQDIDNLKRVSLSAKTSQLSTVSQSGAYAFMKILESRNETI